MIWGDCEYYIPVVRSGYCAKTNMFMTYKMFEETAAGLQNKMIQTERCIGMSCGVKGLVNNMWYHSVPAEAPVFQRNTGTMNEKTLLHIRLLQTGFCAPHSREAVILWASTLDCQLFLCRYLHHSETIIVYLLIIYEVIHPLLFYLQHLHIKLHKLPWCLFAVKAIICHYNAVQIATCSAFVPEGSYVSFRGFVMLR